MKLLLLTHDAVESLDRRIVNECRVFTEHGWQVHIILTSYAARAKAHEIEKGIVVDPVPIPRLNPVYDPLFHESPAAEMRDVFTRRFSRESSVFRVARSYGRAMRSVRSWLSNDPMSPYQATCYAMAEESRQQPHQEPTVFLNRWIRRQTPEGSLLYRGARQAYLAAKKAVTTLRPRAKATGTPLGSAPSEAPAAQWHREAYPLPFTVSFVKKAKELSADAIMACDLPSLPPALQLSLARQTPLIYDSHEFYTEQSCFSEKQKRVLEHHERLGLQHCKLCYVVSEQISTGMQEKYQLPNRPEVLYNAAMFRHTPDQIDTLGVRRRLGLQESERYLLYHGGLVRERNLERMMRAFRAISPKDLALVMLGYGEYDDFAALARQLGGRIIMHPAVPQDDLVHWVTGAEAVIIPYLTADKANEFAMPNKLFDCIELGAPIIANHKLISLKQLVAEHPIGWLGAMDSDEEMQQTLTNGIQWLGNKQGRDAALRAARNQYGWEAQKEVMCRSLHAIGLPGF